MALLLLFSPVRDYSENEKRYLAGRPEVTVSGILEGETQEQLEKFTADQVPGRDFFVGVNAYWNLATGRNGAQGIYHCKQGYLINAPKTYNEKIFTDNLTKFDQFAAQLGVPADLMMVPSTGYLMEEVLPTFHGTYDDDQLYDKAEQIPSGGCAAGPAGGEGNRPDLLPDRPPSDFLWELFALPGLSDRPGGALPLPGCL